MNLISSSHAVSWRVFQPLPMVLPKALITRDWWICGAWLMCSVGWGRSRTFLTCVTEEAKVQSPSSTVFPEDTAIAWPKPPCAAAWDSAVISYLILSASALAPPAAGVIVLHWESCPFLAQNPLMAPDLMQSKCQRPCWGSGAFPVGSGY